MQLLFSQAAAHHLRQARQHRFQRLPLVGVARKRVLVADRRRPIVFADVAVEPSARIEAARLAGERQPQRAEVLLQPVFVAGRQVADFADALLLQPLLHHLADAGNLAHVQRRQEFCLRARQNPQNAVGLGLVGANLGDQPRSADPDGAVQIAWLPSWRRAAACAARSGGPCRRSVPVMST